MPDLQASPAAFNLAVHRCTPVATAGVHQPQPAADPACTTRLGGVHRRTIGQNSGAHHRDWTLRLTVERRTSRAAWCDLNLHGADRATADGLTQRQATGQRSTLRRLALPQRPAQEHANVR